MEFNPPKKINVRFVEKKGLGVFATEKIFKGETIEECPVFSLGKDDTPQSQFFKNYRFSYPKERSSSESVLAWGYGSLFNHDVKPNADWEEHPEWMGFRFFALRDIEQDEEITICYGGESYWKSRSEIELVFNQTKKLFFCLNDNDVNNYNIEEEVEIIKLSSNPHEFDKYKIERIPTLLTLNDSGYEIDRKCY